jgi:hypothetical protein
MRTSLRDLSNDRPKMIIIPDKGAAEWISSLFPGSSLQHLDCGLGQFAPKTAGRHREYPDQNERQKACRSRKKAKKEAMAAIMVDCHEIIFKDPSVEYERAFQGTVLADKYQKAGIELIDHTIIELVGILYGMHEERVPKEKNMLFSPARYDAALSDGTDRGTGNVVECNNIWLDFDGGAFKAEHLSTLLPRQWFFAWNTASCAKDDHRWRALIPTSRMMSPGEYGEITKMLAALMDDSGHEHKLDKGKLGAASLFYGPCRARDEESTFFEEFGVEGRFLDVDKWLEAAELYRQSLPVKQRKAASCPGVSDGRVEEILSRHRPAFATAGQGDEAFWLAAIELKGVGADLNAIEALLEQEAFTARSSGDRHRQVQRIMKALRAGHRQEALAV